MRINPDSEQVLVNQAADDPEAFRALYDLYIERVYGYVAARVDDRKDAEDIVSNVFLSVVRGLGQIRNQHNTSFAAWLFTIARNAVNDFYRRNNKAVLSLEALQETHADDDSPLDVLISQHETAHELRRLIADLPERRREIILLKFFSGLRNQEIASVLGLDERTVASHLSRALKDLYQRYQESESPVERLPHDSR